MAVDPNQLMAMLGQGGGADPSQQMYGGPGGGDPATQQAVWSQFPSTDPAQVTQMLSGGVQGWHQYVDAIHADIQQLQQMQSDAANAHNQATLAQPPTQQTPPPRGGGPGVGGGVGG